SFRCTAAGWGGSTFCAPNGASFPTFPSHGGSNRVNESRGPAREGSALLQGLAICGEDLAVAVLVLPGRGPLPRELLLRGPHALRTPLGVHGPSLPHRLGCGHRRPHGLGLGTAPSRAPSIAARSACPRCRKSGPRGRCHS